MKKCSPNKAGALSMKQRKILEELKDNLEIVNDYHGYTFEKIEIFKKDPDVNEIFTDYQNILFKSIRANLHNHPLVPTEFKNLLLEWRYTYERLGNKELLRKVIRGFEVGVKRPLTKEDAKLKVAIEELRLGMDVEPPSEKDDNNVLTLGEILKKVRPTRIFDPDNPPPIQKLRKWTEVHRILVKREMVNSTRQAFLRKAKRLSPSLFSKKKIKKK